jgi:hypothetical protein
MAHIEVSPRTQCLVAMALLRCGGERVKFAIGGCTLAL